MGSKENIELQKMRDIISSIASEVQQYQNYENDSDSNDYKSSEEENHLNNVLAMKSKLKLKDELIAKLKKDLSTACIVTRTVSSAKEKQSLISKNQINKLQEENVKLNQNLKNQAEAVSRLTEENKKLDNIINGITAFVNHSFEELQKSDTTLTDSPSVTEKLELIVLSCGQHYTNFCKAQETCTLLERKNRFLTNKMYILESNLESLTEQLKHQQYLNNKQPKDNNSDNNKPTIYKTVVAYSDLKMKDSFQEIADSSSSKDYQCKLENSSDLPQKLEMSPRFTILKKIINDKDGSRKDLTAVSQDICSLHQGKKINVESIGR